MKRVAVAIMVVILSLLLVGCVKKCYTCGKSLSGGGYTVFGNDYCEDCFKYDLGI